MVPHPNKMDSKMKKHPATDYYAQKLYAILKAQDGTKTEPYANGKAKLNGDYDLVAAVDALLNEMDS